MSNHKLIEGFMEYLEKAEDPNYIQSIEVRGTYAILEAFEAWRYETNPEDHESIPKKYILSEFYKKYKHIAPP